MSHTHNSWYLVKWNERLFAFDIRTWSFQDTLSLQPCKWPAFWHNPDKETNLSPQSLVPMLRFLQMADSRNSRILIGTNEMTKPSTILLKQNENTMGMWRRKRTLDCVTNQNKYQSITWRPTFDYKSLSESQKFLAENFWQICSNFTNKSVLIFLQISLTSSRDQGFLQILSFTNALKLVFISSCCSQNFWKFRKLMKIQNRKILTLLHKLTKYWAVMLASW